jgi:hypothetical protein
MEIHTVGKPVSSHFKRTVILILVLLGVMGVAAVLVLH